MTDDDRVATLDELCRRAMTSRSERELYLAYERNQIAETHPDYRRARDIFERNGGVWVGSRLYEDGTHNRLDPTGYRGLPFCMLRLEYDALGVDRDNREF